MKIHLEMPQMEMTLYFNKKRASKIYDTYAKDLLFE